MLKGSRPAASNAGREHNTSLEDRHQRVLEENMQLKVQRNELQEKVKDLTTKFRRLIRDLKISPEAVDVIVNNSKGGPVSHAGDAFGKEQRGDLQQTISNLTQDRDALQQQLKTALERVQHLEHSAAAFGASRGGGAAGGFADANLAMLQHNATVDQQTIESLREELRRAHQRYQEHLDARMHSHQATGGRAETQHTFHHAQRDEQLRTVELQLQQLRLKNSELVQTVEILSRERDSYSLQLRLAKESENQARNDPQQQHTFPSSLDPMTLLELQQQIQEKANNIAVISNRLQYSQSQVQNLKSEVERLLSELRASHQQTADVKRLVFDLEHEKASLQLRCERVDQLQGTLTLKDEELLRMEQQLLKNVERLNSVAKDVEHAVRREMATRLSEAESSREEADRLRRQREQQLYDTEAQLSDWKRKAELQTETCMDLEKRLKKEQRDRQEIAEKCATLTGISAELGDDVQQAITLAAIRRRQNANGGPQDLWDTLNWDEQWEAAKLREALSTSTLDLELAEARLSQMQAQLDGGRDLLQRISEERDTLLDENRRMQNRLCGIQTCLAKSQMDRYRKAVVLGRGSANGTLVFALRQFSQLAPFGGAGTEAPSLFFFTLDGFEGYDTMVSRMISLSPQGDAPNTLDIVFAYENLTVDEVTVSALQRTMFVLQLHAVIGDGTSILALAEVRGASLLTAAENAGNGDGALFSETLTFVSGEGQVIGTMLADVVADNVFLPLLVTSEAREQALAFSRHGQVGMSPSQVKQLLYTLRNVTGIQIAVHRIQNLPLPSSTAHHSTTMLSATKPFYVYCTASGGGTHTVIEDRILECQHVTVLPTSMTLTFDPLTTPERVLHRFTTIDASLISFLQEVHISFVVFDRTNDRVEDHVCMATIPLRLLLQSEIGAPVQGTVRMTGPEGGESHGLVELDYGFSWVSVA